MIIILMNKLMQVEALNSKVRIVLQDDSVIEGVSWGIIPAEDDEGEDLGYDEMFFVMDISESQYIFLKDEDIKEFEEI